MKKVALLLCALVIAVVFSPMSGSQVDAATTESTPSYQVLKQNAKGKQVSLEFKSKAAFEKYLREHPVKGKFSIQEQIRSVFYEHKDGRGWSFNVDASRNPTVIFNFGQFNDQVSSIRTHSHGNYTIIYEHINAQGRALALANTGALYNLVSPMGDGERTWNDEASSAIVRSN
ncbi:hypothetical protein [Melghirimyces algeriensis]|uniref:Uncharacterized protein n=1 Tax=Melghirimyces algeriensis TaxID=910412 RepID=A0A521CDY6_9BACL|nr:hypothetical protein [Melghirimyces algeriensis]SMO57585.1 hypothetical protein SAMN06264849_103294 [Melghirimyces algeriensis]